MAPAPCAIPPSAPARAAYRLGEGGIDTDDAAGVEEEVVVVEMRKGCGERGVRGVGGTERIEPAGEDGWEGEDRGDNGAEDAVDRQVLSVGRTGVVVVLVVAVLVLEVMDGELGAVEVEIKLGWCGRSGRGCLPCASISSPI